jgi:hypothetical protein
MITGYNTDVGHHEVVLHVQTEDKGLEVASIESLVYVGGQILGKRRIGYRDLLEGGEGKDAIGQLMDRQHRLMIAEIRSGNYDDQLAELGMVSHEVVAAAKEAGSALEPIPLVDDEPVPTIGSSDVQVPGAVGQSLDEIILEYLNSEAEQEHLILMMDSDGDLVPGEEVGMRFQTKSSVSAAAVPGTLVAVKMISTVSSPATLAAGETDEKGELGLTIRIPDLQQGTGALIITASSKLGTAEIKQLL